MRTEIVFGCWLVPNAVGGGGGGGSGGGGGGGGAAAGAAAGVPVAGVLSVGSVGGPDLTGPP